MNDSDDKKPIVSNAMMQFLQARLMEIFWSCPVGDKRHFIGLFDHCGQE